jgi:hypothetical protein
VTERDLAVQSDQDRQPGEHHEVEGAIRQLQVVVGAERLAEEPERQRAADH